jgi:nitrogen fixation/metabolism regulation signal transduction histidine kinase
MMQPVLHNPFTPYLYSAPGTQLSYTGCVALPALALDPYLSQLWSHRLPGLLAVDFPARERDFLEQRDQTILLLAGLASLIFVTAALLALLLTWSIFGPVRILVTATQRLAGGDFAAPLPEGGRDEIGDLATSFGSMRDKLQQAQADLAERERYLTTVLNRVSVGVAVLSAEEELVVLNPAGRDILAGFFRGDEEPAARQAQRLLAGLRNAADQGGGPGDVELRSEDARRTLRGRVAPLALPDGRRDIMVVFEDVTEFLNNKRLALNAELARQVAHEIKNPLTPIQLSVQLLRQAYEDGSPDLDRIFKDSIRQVLDQVTLLRAIATEFSLLGRPGDLECTVLDLPALVRKVVTSYQAAPSGAKGVGPQVTLKSASVPPVMGHADSLVKVLGNLMENSLDACGDADRLVLTLDWRVTEDEVTLLWQDSGPGVPAEVADRLFDPYFSTKSRGTGLGLAICRNLLDKMGGKIALHNRAGDRGAVAEVTLPRAAPDEIEAAGSPDQPAE